MLLYSMAVKINMNTFFDFIKDHMTFTVVVGIISIIGVIYTVRGYYKKNDKQEVLTKGEFSPVIIGDNATVNYNVNNNVTTEKTDSNNNEEESPGEISNLDEIDERSCIPATDYFARRFGEAFPDNRELQVFTKPDVCIERLKILFEPNKYEYAIDPIWYFRGDSNNCISKFEVINKKKILINGYSEIKVKKIYAYYSPAYYKRFVYVEAFGDKQSGINKIDKNEIAYYCNEDGYCCENFGLYKGKPIKITEYNSGAAVIKGKVVKLDGSQVERRRYLTPYNFIICAHFNSMNKNKYDLKMGELLNGMLTGDNSIDDIIDYVESMPKHDFNYA